MTQVNLLQSRNRLSDIENRLDKGEEDGEGMEWDFGISRCKLVYTGWMKNKVVLQSTGDSIQYLEINPIKNNILKNILRRMHIGV